MKDRMIAVVGMMALTLAAGACSRDATVEQRDPAAARDVDRAAQLQKQRDEELSKIDERVAKLERDYDAQRGTRPSGTSGTTVVRDEVKSDVPDVKKAVANLRTTTAENWWERHEAALKTAFGDVEADVRRFAGARTLPAPTKASRVTDASGEPVSTAPFTSSRDKFVADMRGRVEAMKKALDGVKASGARKTALADMHARVDKLGEDIDRLASASAEDWWDLSKARVNDYIDRVEKSIARVDDNKR
jgi:hypothetical protein